MLGLLSISCEKKRIDTRIKMQSLRVGNGNALHLTLPRISRRMMKKAAHHLFGTRVILPDGFNDTQIVRDAGMIPVDGAELYFRIADILCAKMMQALCVQADSAALSVFGTRISDTDMVIRMASDKRAVILDFPDSEKVENRLLSEYGIAISPKHELSKYPIRIIMNLVKDDFSVHIIKEDITYAFENVTLELPERFSAVPNTHVKGSTVALLQSGELTPREVGVCVHCKVI